MSNPPAYPGVPQQQFPVMMIPYSHPDAQPVQMPIPVLTTTSGGYAPLKQDSPVLPEVENGENVIVRAEFDVESLAGHNEDFGWGCCIISSLLLPCLCPCITLGLHPWARREEKRVEMAETHLIVTDRNIIYRTPGHSEQIISIKSVSEVRTWKKIESAGKYVFDVLEVHTIGCDKPALSCWGVVNAEAIKNAIISAQHRGGEQSTETTPGSSRSLVQELVTLSTLRQQGTISEEEFQAAKRKLLA